MATPQKVTSVNHLPGYDNDRFPVYSKQFNKLIDALTDGLSDLTVNDATVTGDLTVTGTTTLNGPLVLGDAAADALTVNATATYEEPINYSNATTITAGTTQTMAGATALTEEVNNITTVANANDGVALPTAVTGRHVYVKNSGSNNLRVWTGNASDAIDAQSVTALGRYILLAPSSSMDFYAKDATTWETSKDEGITLNTRTPASGILHIKSTDNAGDTTTVITNASQAAARTYTIPDAGTNASFVMTEGAQDINGIKTFGSGIVLPAGAVGTPSIQIGAVDTGLYQVSGVQTGFAQDGVLVATFDSLGMKIDSVRAGVQMGSTPVGTVAIAEYGDGRDMTTVLTLTNFIVGVPGAAAAALGFGNIVYAYPAGQHLELVSSLSSLVLTAAGTAVATDTGLGSVVASGVVSVLSGTGTFEDRLTGQTITTDAVGGAAVSALTAATAGIGTGISLNVAGSVKNVFLNTAGTWNADNTGNLTATGTIVLKWSRM